MKYKNIFFYFIISFIFILLNQINAQEIHLLCVSFDQDDSVKLQQQFAKIDTIIINKNVIIISPQKYEYIYDENFINVFSPEILFEISDTNIVNNCNHKIIASNIKIYYEESELKFFQSEIITLSDTLKIGIVGIVTPDFLNLYPELSSDIEFRFDIFDCAKEVVDSLRNQNVDIIISLNYLGDFLDEELIKKIPEIDFIIDGFDTYFKRYYRNDIHPNKIININFQQPLMIDITFYLERNEDNQVIIDSLGINSQ